jgi:taurine dioxygenase
MFKYKYLDNGWAIQIEEDIKTLSDDDLKEMTRMVVNNMVVIFKDQVLTPDDEVRICDVIGEYQRYPADSERVKHIRLNDGILRVTGQKNQYGEEGLFGHRAALDWHANQPSNKERKPLIWLYGASGTKGSRTSWINNIESYEGLSDEMKDKIKDIKIYCGYQRGRYSNSSFFVDHVNDENPINLVQVNKEGKKGLYFPFLQIFGFEGYDDATFNEIMDELTAHVLQEKYAYHHDWDDGDVVVSEQWLSIHKRWEFDHMDERVLHRIAFDYSKVYN